jgi:hypothetical protein
MVGWTQLLNYPHGSPQRSERWKELGEVREDHVPVFCVPSPKYNVLEHTFKSKNEGEVEVWNEKVERWETLKLGWYYDICPQCGTLMRVFYIPGTTWIAACSKKCYEEIDALMKRGD